MSVVSLTVPLELADGGQSYAGSATGLGDLFVVNTTGYNSISVQLSGTWVGTVTYSISNDGVNWTSIAASTSNGTSIYPTTGIYFKAAVTAYTSGDVEALAYLRFQPVADISVDADLGDIDANTAATAANTAQANVYLEQIASDVGDLATPIVANVTSNGVLFTTDTLGYQAISIQLAGDWQANCIFQVSNDNVNFANVQGYTFNNYMNSINTAQDNGVYIFPVTGRYFQVVVSNYKAGTVNCTAYLRNQTLAGIGETMLTQAMDPSNNTPINVNYQNTGQQAAAASVPVTLSNENIRDLYISSRVMGTPLNSGTIIPMDGAYPIATNPGGWIDVSQYRSIYVNYVCSGSLTGTLAIEVSNDGVNLLTNPGYNFYDTQSIAASPMVATGGNMALATNVVGTRVGNLGWRYLRFRLTGGASGTGTLTVNAMLRMTPTTYGVSYANIGAINSSGMPNAATMINSNTIPASFPPLTVGGTDRSIIRSELIGNMGAGGIANSYNTNGPYARNAYCDLSGSLGVAGPQPFLSEDKTYPVNVRLERSTNGQDSVQDLLQQILVELKALNYYTRETPMALNSGLMTSLLDDSENFADDQLTSRLTKGH